jgi:hypothetical protein
VKISVETDVKAAQAALVNLAKKQIPFATAYALTQTAKDAQAAVEKELPKVFDRPTPYTLRAIRTSPATKRKLVAEVLIKDGKTSAGVSRDSSGKPVKSLFAQVQGGSRAKKPFENLLQARGLMPQGWYAVPGKSIPLNQYGNVPGSIITRVLSQLQAHSVFNMDRNESAASKGRQYRSKSKRLQRYFVVMPGTSLGARLAPGIWERTSFGFGSSIRPLFIYVQQAPRYTKRLPFDAIVERTVAARIEANFYKGAQLAAQTARA